MADKGKMADKGGPETVVEDLFRCMRGLGGLLIVAFVSPVGASRVDVSDRSALSESLLSAASKRAEQRDREEEERRQRKAAEEAVDRARKARQDPKIRALEVATQTELSNRRRKY
jgi:hypothetical protein